MRQYESITGIILRADGPRVRTITVWRQEEPTFDPILVKQKITESIMAIQAKRKEEKKEFLLITIPVIQLAEAILDTDPKINSVKITDGTAEMGVVIFNTPDFEQEV